MTLAFRQGKGFFIIGAFIMVVVFAMVFWDTLNTTKISGRYYQRITRDKDLIADILPPPQFIIEPYLIVYQMLDATDEAQLEHLAGKAKELQSKYEARHEFWARVLPEGQIKQELIVSSYRPAVEFFEIMDKQIVPAILGGDKEKAHTLIRDVLTPKYEDHRLAIENVVRTANEAIRREERESDVIVKRRLILMVLLGMGVIGIALLYLRAEGALRKLLAELELRVEERTKQLTDANQSLLAANKELEGFSYSVSHDLRAPLRAIDGFSMMVLREYADKLDDEGRRKLNVIRSNSQQMGKLIDDLLSFCRLGRKEMANVSLDMEVLVRRAWEELTTSKPERRIGFSVQRLPHCMGDQWLVKEAVVNLLSNAMKFTRHRENAIVEVGAYVEGDRNVYFVKDNGVGFDMRYYDKLFGVFQKLHGADEFEGTGVGLAIVARIIGRHGGRVWAEGQEGEGATFYFTLERTADERKHF